MKVIFNLYKKIWATWAGLLIISFYSCDTAKQSSKYQFNDGWYKVRSGRRFEKVYVLTGSDTIKQFDRKLLSANRIDTTKIISIAFPAQKPDEFTDHSFRHGTFDADVLTVLFKYRPPANHFPPQFNATFNGALFLGYRTDVYKLSYNETPLRIFRRHVTHYGYSAGFFTGLGSARIDEFDTNNALNIEYDGLVNLSGVALILAIDKLSAGITCGVDYLLDRNRHLWVNNGKSWVGLSLGLNLN